MIKFLKSLFSKNDTPEPLVPPGEIKVDRNWTDDPATDTTVITIGGQVHPEHLEAIRAILDGRAHPTRYPKNGRKLRPVIRGML